MIGARVARGTTCKGRSRSFGSGRSGTDAERGTVPASGPAARMASYLHVWEGMCARASGTCHQEVRHAPPPHPTPNMKATRNVRQGQRLGGMTREMGMGRRSRAPPPCARLCVHMSVGMRTAATRRAPRPPTQGALHRPMNPCRGGANAATPS